MTEKPEKPEKIKKSLNSSGNKNIGPVRAINDGSFAVKSAIAKSSLFLFIAGMPFRVFTLVSILSLDGLSWYCTRVKRLVKLFEPISHPLVNFLVKLNRDYNVVRKAAKEEEVTSLLPLLCPTPFLSLSPQRLYRKRRGALKGQSVVEVVLFAPLIITIMLVLVFAGTALVYKQNVDAVAREATRVIAKNTGEGSVTLGTNRAKQVAGQYKMSLDKLTVTIDGANDLSAPARGAKITATVSYSFKFLAFDGIIISGKHSEVVECWRARGDESSGGNCPGAGF